MATTATHGAIIAWGFVGLAALDGVFAGGTPLGDVNPVTLLVIVAVAFTGRAAMYWGYGADPE